MREVVNMSVRKYLVLVESRPAFADPPRCGGERRRPEEPKLEMEVMGRRNRNGEDPIWSEPVPEASQSFDRIAHVLQGFEGSNVVELPPFEGRDLYRATVNLGAVTPTLPADRRI